MLTMGGVYMINGKLFSRVFRSFPIQGFTRKWNMRIIKRSIYDAGGPFWKGTVYQIRIFLQNLRMKLGRGDSGQRKLFGAENLSRQAECSPGSSRGYTGNFDIVSDYNVF
jgi:hypothetical protein